MNSLPIKFPTESENAAQWARHYRKMAVSERFDELLDLIAFADAAIEGRPDRKKRLALYRRQEREEMRLLAEIQRRGHV